MPLPFQDPQLQLSSSATAATTAPAAAMPRILSPAEIVASASNDAAAAPPTVKVDCDCTVSLCHSFKEVLNFDQCFLASSLQGLVVGGTTAAI